jgi:glycosyltransferase involved in cell wall biosynthesis
MNDSADAPAGPPPKVSVLIITYNHEALIAQAIESALMQRTDFACEIVIGEDCSTDGTRAIVAGYQQRYPGRIRALMHEKNLGHLGKLNFIRTHENCRGKYVALLEGDDYWISPDKIQLQADYLDAHPECCACYHNAWIETDRIPPERHIFYPPGQPAFCEFADLLRTKLPPTASVMYRRGLFEAFPDWFFEIQMGDLPFHALNSQFGGFGYLDEIMSVYRVHDGGVWTTKGLVDRTKAEIKAFELIDTFFKGRHRETIASVINQRQFFMSIGYDGISDPANARLYFWKYLAGHRKYPTIPRRLILRQAMKIYFPRLFHALKHARDTGRRAQS